MSPRSAVGSSLATKLAVVVVLVSVVSLAAATVVGVTSGRSLGRDLFEGQLLTERSSSAFDVELHMAGLAQLTGALAASPEAARAIGAFDAGLDELDASLGEPPGDEVAAVTAALVASTFDPLLAAGRNPDLGDIVPDDPAALHLQYRYVVDIGAIDRPSDVDDALDGSDWSDTHARYHPAYRTVVDHGAVVDLYLIEPDDARIVYSVAKGPDLATSLDTGPFSGSLVAAAVGTARSGEPGSVVIGDLGFYDPTIVRPVGALAAPVFDGDELAGIVVVLYDGTVLTDILTARSNVEDLDGSGDGDDVGSYLIGADGLLRTEIPRFASDTAAALDLATEAGAITADERRQVEDAGTAVLAVGAPDATVADALSGSTDVIERTTLDGSTVFASAAPLAVPGVEWFVISEVDAAEATDPLDRFEDILVAGAAAFIIALTFWAVAWANRIVGPVRAISDRVAALDPNLAPVEVPSRSPTEFHQLAASFASMRASLIEQRDRLAAARAERLALMRRMLPRDVADRIAAGEPQELEQIPQATVVVVIVAGLGDLVRSGDQGASQALVGHLHAQLDEVGLVHGVDRVKIIGDAYFGVCGHDRLYIDHGPRVVSFAVDARDAVREAGRRSSVDVDVAVAINTGPVTVGMTGGERLVYDVFGETVSVAHQLARLAPTGDIVVSDATRRLLPSSTVVHPVTEGDQTVWRIDIDASEVVAP
ncbi:MAG: adenylate/guanylate cyclase domain-containing protein [Acidimicrobiales bacterium]